MNGLERLGLMVVFSVFTGFVVLAAYGLYAVFTPGCPAW